MIVSDRTRKILVAAAIVCGLAGSFGGLMTTLNLIKTITFPGGYLDNPFMIYISFFFFAVGLAGVILIPIKNQIAAIVMAIGFSGQVIALFIGFGQAIGSFNPIFPNPLAPVWAGSYVNLLPLLLVAAILAFFNKTPKTE